MDQLQREEREWTNQRERREDQSEREEKEWTNQRERRQKTNQSEREEIDWINVCGKDNFQIIGGAHFGIGVLRFFTSSLQKLKNKANWTFA